MLQLAKNYDKALGECWVWKMKYVLYGYGIFVNLHSCLEEEEKMTPEQLAIKNVGKQDPKRHLEEKVDSLMSTNIVQCLGAMLDAVVFK